MKKIIIAIGMLAAGVTAAAAQSPWARDRHPYERRYHSVCQDKAQRLHGYERRAASDGRLSWRERRVVDALRRDLDRTCGRFRWRG